MGQYHLPVRNLLQAMFEYTLTKHSTHQLALKVVISISVVISALITSILSTLEGEQP